MYNAPKLYHEVMTINRTKMQVFSNGDNNQPVCAGSRFCSTLGLSWALLRHYIIISIFRVTNLVHAVSTKCMAANRAFRQNAKVGLRPTSTAYQSSLSTYEVSKNVCSACKL